MAYTPCCLFTPCFIWKQRWYNIHCAAVAPIACTHRVMRASPRRRMTSSWCHCRECVRASKRIAMYSAASYRWRHFTIGACIDVIIRYLVTAKQCVSYIGADDVSGLSACALLSGAKLSDKLKLSRTRRSYCQCRDVYLKIPLNPLRTKSRSETTNCSLYQNKRI